MFPSGPPVIAPPVPPDTGGKKNVGVPEVVTRPTAVENGLTVQILPSGPEASS